MNYTIKIVVDEVLCEFISVIEGISFGIDEGKFMNLKQAKFRLLYLLIRFQIKSMLICVLLKWIKHGK